MRKTELFCNLQMTPLLNHRLIKDKAVYETLLIRRIRVSWKQRYKFHILFYRFDVLESHYLIHKGKPQEISITIKVHLELNASCYYQWRQCLLPEVFVGSTSPCHKNDFLNWFLYRKLHSQQSVCDTILFIYLFEFFCQALYRLTWRYSTPPTFINALHKRSYPCLFC